MISIDVKQSNRRRFSASIRIAENRHLLLITSPHYSITQIAELLARHQAFLQKSLTIKATIHKWPVKPGAEIYIFGRKLAIEFSTKTTSLQLNSFTIKTRKKELSQKEFYAAITDFLAPHILNSITRNQKIMDIKKVGTVKFKLVKSQWGSCTNTKNLSFSKKLIHYPADCIEYVVIHELAHIFEHNHSKEFWNIVKKYWPDYKVDRKELRERVYG